MDLRGLQALVAVAEAGSITSAAEVLGYSQPAVSRQLASLERAVGDQLYVRVRDGVALTAAGERLLPAARTILQLARALAAR